jgi:hypothetical protein
MSANRSVYFKKPFIISLILLGLALTTTIMVFLLIQVSFSGDKQEEMDNAPKKAQNG